MLLRPVIFSNVFSTTVISRFSQYVSERYNGDMTKMRALSIIEEEGGKRVNMAHLVKFWTKHLLDSLPCSFIPATALCRRIA